VILVGIGEVILAGIGEVILAGIGEVILVTKMREEILPGLVGLGT
jgi:hypothetical protein